MTALCLQKKKAEEAARMLFPTLAKWELWRRKRKRGFTRISHSKSPHAFLRWYLKCLRHCFHLLDSGAAQQPLQANHGEKKKAIVLKATTSLLCYAPAVMMMVMMATSSISSPFVCFLLCGGWGKLFCIPRLHLVALVAHLWRC